MDSLKSPIGLRLTNYTPEKSLAFGELNVKFSYKREDLELEVHSNNHHFFSPVFFHHGENYLTNSGQAAITMAMLALRNKSYYSPTDIYRGTLDAGANLDIHFSSNVACEDIWICSSHFSKNDFDRILLNIGKLKSIVIDTTCWRLNSDILIELINLFKDKEMILIRSHSKLDMHGIEYGSLGSFCSNFQIGEKLRTIYRIFSFAPSLCDISEDIFITDKFRQNNERCLRIEDNAKVLESFLIDYQSKITFPYHLKYFFIEICEKKLSQLIALFKAQGIEYRCLRSFGFSFWNLDYFEDDRTKKKILRICVSDNASLNELKKVTWCLQKVLS